MKRKGKREWYSREEHNRQRLEEESRRIFTAKKKIKGTATSGQSVEDVRAYVCDNFIFIYCIARITLYLLNVSIIT